MIFSKTNASRWTLPITDASAIGATLSTLSKTARRSVEVLSGHTWTVVPHGISSVSALGPRRGKRFDTILQDEVRGVVPIRGIFHQQDSPKKRLVILLHGIASSPKAGYIRTMARTLFSAGHDVLRLALRGALSTGSDHYHAGQTEDLHAVLADPRIARYDEIFIIGYSLGGQIATRFSLLTDDPRLRGVAAICAPISMKSSQVALDARAMAPYRYAILWELKQKYRRLAREGERVGRPMKTSIDAVNAVRTFYQWDETVVCPRYGFASVEDYYDTVSVGPQLKELKIPALFIFSEFDPLVPYDPLRPYLKDLNPTTHVKVLNQGGHLGFSSNLQLGYGRRTGLCQQVTAWMNLVGRETSTSR
jgi:uncharacterized protein